MQRRSFVRKMVFGGMAAATLSSRSLCFGGPAEKKGFDEPAMAGTRTQPQLKFEEMIDRVVKREADQVEFIRAHSPFIETYIQIVKLDRSMGTVPRSDHYFLDQADFRGRPRVRSMLDNGFSFPWMFSFIPAGFLQMIFIDNGEFDKHHYSFESNKSKPRDFLGDVRCLVLDVTSGPKVSGPRFRGSIWVEDQDYTIVRLNGVYAPANHMSWKTFEDEYYLHSDSWRTNAKSGYWLPSYVYSQEMSRRPLFDVPSYKSATHLWGYESKQGSRQEELSKLLVESPNRVKDETEQHDRSPLEALREWRHEAESNMLDSLEKGGLLAPAGEVDKILNTIVNNLEITNGLDNQLDLHCRVLLTGNFESFSIGNTIVLSRGLIDVVPDEETLAALLAHEVADAMLAKPYQDQYAFSDLPRLTPEQILKRVSFREEKEESVENSAKAMELLKKSPYSGNLGRAGLFLSQLSAKAKELKQLITPRLGNPVYFASQLMQEAPPLQPANVSQIAALPLGSRIKIDPWNSNLSLMKTKPVARYSMRDKMPFEVMPLPPYLTRYAETSSAQSDSNTITAFDN